MLCESCHSFFHCLRFADKVRAIHANQQAIVISLGGESYVFDPVTLKHRFGVRRYPGSRAPALALSGSFLAHSSPLPPPSEEDASTATTVSVIGGSSSTGGPFQAWQAPWWRLWQLLSWQLSWPPFRRIGSIQRCRDDDGGLVGRWHVKKVAETYEAVVGSLEMVQESQRQASLVEGSQAAVDLQATETDSQETMRDSQAGLQAGIAICLMN